jgi:hypothetical protein
MFVKTEYHRALLKERETILGESSAAAFGQNRNPCEKFT